ncbi:MAG TPA: A/G-specific adenine glycosylase [Phycisphaerae bacterium]|nr:A/G-specific adenine glycosylase [Phycisphaerae bacterium]HOI54889.1 A/G-specific adenine glycosylase [Phycisphaerae bacterium]
MSRTDPLPFIRRTLLAWYDRHSRDLPWRRTSDPYAIWVSEIMLQQTQVATAIPYYERFLKRFPTVESLARARVSSVLKQWEGLGYYGRARRLHEAARLVVRDYGGRLPSSAEELRRLPGVGRYTAGAIASIAFGAGGAALDGNVIRVLSRLMLLEDDPATAQGQAVFWDWAERLAPRRDSGLWNQAVMDLGATVCTPRQPLCLLCPLGEACRARADGRQNELPAKTPRKAVPHYDVAVGVVFNDGKVLIDRRPAGAMLGGMWEFPGGKRLDGETIEECLHRELREELGITVGDVRPLVTTSHAYSHFRVTLHAFECRLATGRPRPLKSECLAWVSPAELDRYAFPRGSRKIIEAFRQRDR